MTSPSPSDAAVEIAEALHFKREVGPKLIEALKLLNLPTAETIDICDDDDGRGIRMLSVALTFGQARQILAALLLAGVKP